jgi:IS30 family transposase
MPKGSVLSERERGMVEAYRREKVPLREIARRLSRSDSVIRNFLKNPRKYATTKRKAKQSKLSARDERRIVKLASNSTISVSKIKSELDLPVADETIRKVLHSSPNIIRSKMHKAPNLTPDHKQKRLDFAKVNMARQWDTVKSSLFPVFFSDKCYNAITSY